MDDFSFGAWLQRRRRALDMTEAELGRRTGVAAATIRKIEADERRLSLQVAERLADAFATVVAICQQLDGLPLVLELAAARLRLFSLAMLHARLYSSLLATLTLSLHDLPARQQTVRATLDCGRTLELAGAALGDDITTENALAALVDHSLMRGSDDAAGERRYALEQLSVSGREAAMRAGWAGALLAQAEAAERQLRSPNQSAWLMRLEAERANLRALLGWALGDLHVGAVLFGAADRVPPTSTRIAPQRGRRSATRRSQPRSSRA